METQYCDICGVVPVDTEHTYCDKCCDDICEYLHEKYWTSQEWVVDDNFTIYSTI